MSNSSDSLVRTGPISAGTVLARLAAELLRSRAGLLALESSITAVARSTDDPGILHGLQGLDLMGQEIEAYASICCRLGGQLPQLPNVDAVGLLADVTLDGVWNAILASSRPSAQAAGSVDLF